MVKEPSSNTQIKKKRKVVPSEADSETDIYQKVCDFEENEGKIRSSAEDSKILLRTHKEFHNQLTHVKNTKLSNENTPNKLDKLSCCLTELVVKTCIIKKLNRIDKLKQVAEREALNVKKQNCDSMKLTYQNVVYELHHLVAETNKCLSFKSDDQDIELISFEEFMKTAPESVTSKFINFNPNDPDQDHALRLARLEWELTQRKSLAEECKLLEEKKKAVVAEITEQKDKLNDLHPLLNMIIKATKPLQEHLGISKEYVRKEHALAGLLPDPLYILYANILAYKNVFTTPYEISILGDKDDATQFNEAQEVSNSNNLNDDDSEPESDLPEVEEVVEVKKRRHRKSAQPVDPLEEKKKRLLEVHPLKVELTLSINDGPQLTTVFSYYTKLKIVTANAKVDVSADVTANTAREILIGQNILSELLASDTGLESPNPSTSYLLRKMGLGSFQLLIPDIGYAYRWAQTICGINFLTPRKFCEKLSQQNIEVILKLVKKRLNSRVHLANQMQLLEQNMFPVIPETVNCPVNHVSALSKWSCLTYQDFCQAQFTKPLIDEEIVSTTDLFYSVKLTRGEAVLQTFVVIKNTYPLPPPIFALNLTYNGEFNSTNCDEIRDLERAVNSDWDYGSKSAPWLLSAQLIHLCSYLDVYLESLDSKAFPPNAKFIRSVGGRNRKRPFKFKRIGTGIFTQY